MSESKDDNYGMEYMERVGAHIDSGIFDLIHFFLDRGYDTEFCCSGLFEDHFDKKENDTFPRVEMDIDKYDLEVMRPYIAFDSIFHTLENGQAVVDDTVYYLKEALDGTIGVRFFSGRPSRESNDLDNSVYVSLNFDIGSPYQGHPASFQTYTLTVGKLGLQKCFNEVDKDVEFYDDIVKSIFKVIQVIVDEPILGKNMNIDINGVTESITVSIPVRFLPDTFDDSNLEIIDETNVEQDEQAVGEQVPCYVVFGEFEDVVRELYEKPDETYLESLYEEDDFSMDSFEHPE